MFETFRTYLQNKVQITDEQFEQISHLLFYKKVKRGQILLREGEVGKSVYFVANGCLRSYVIDCKGKEHIIQFAPEDWWIADQNSVIKREPAMFFIDALEDSELILMDRDFNVQVALIVPEMNQMTNMLLQNRLKALQKRLVFQLAATAEERYLDFMKTYPSLALRLPQHSIASYIGVAPESLSRVRKEIVRK